MKLSIRSKLFIGICIPIAVIYLLILILEYRIRSNEAIKSMQSYMKELTECEASEIDVKLSSISQLCRTSAEILGNYHPDNAEDNIGLLRKSIASNDDIFGMAFAYEPNSVIKDRKFFCPYFCRDGADGIMRFVDSSLDDYNYSTESWYTIAKDKGKAVWTEPYYDYALGKVLMCTYSVPIFIDGKFSGVSAADLSLSKFSEEVDEIETTGGYCAIISRTG
ncbi:MAG: cache domain-containing protein, partial [Victivallales bacterium]